MNSKKSLSVSKDFLYLTSEFFTNSPREIYSSVDFNKNVTGHENVIFVISKKNSFLNESLIEFLKVNFNYPILNNYIYDENDKFDQLSIDQLNYKKVLLIILCDSMKNFDEKLEHSIEMIKKNSEFSFSLFLTINSSTSENNINNIGILKSINEIDSIELYKLVKDYFGLMEETKQKSLQIRHNGNQNPNKINHLNLDLKISLDNLENNLIEQALQLSQGNKLRASKILGIKRTTLIEKLKKKKNSIQNQSLSKL
jgi:DNA-binding protein Fis